jgi:hypothetical protein
MAQPGTYAVQKYTVKLGICAALVLICCKRPSVFSSLKRNQKASTAGGESPISTRNQASGRQSKEVQIARRRVRTVGPH